MKRESGAWGYNWATLSLGDINTETCSSRLGVGHKKLMTLPCKKIIVAKTKDVETRRSNSQEWTNLAASSKNDCG
jgi:hypothetical protein